MVGSMQLFLKKTVWKLPCLSINICKAVASRQKPCLIKVLQKQFQMSGLFETNACLTLFDFNVFDSACEHGAKDLPRYVSKEEARANFPYEP